VTPTIRIVALGDSTTAGTPAWQSPLEAPPNGAGDPTSQFAYWLMQDQPDWDVRNKGINGQRSDEIAARFDRDVVAETPAAVVIIAGVNDVYQGRPAQHVIDQLAQMYRRAASARIPTVAGTIIPYNTATADQNDRMRRVNSWIRAQASFASGMPASNMPASGVPLVVADTRAAVAAPSNDDLLFDSPDQLHPTAEGYRRMAMCLRPAIARALARVR
jgi:lysophospholipase L1-like esterase